MKLLSIAFLGATLGLAPLLHAEVEITVPEIYLVPESNDKFVDVIDSLAKMCSNDEYIVKSEVPEKLCFNIDVYPDYYLIRATKKPVVSRNYNIPVTAEEKKDIYFILTTLAKSSLASLATSKSSLNKAGDRIDHIHPFRFLTTVFTDETLKASVSAIRSRSWVWDQFFDGLHRSLKEEAQKNNITSEQVNEFTALMGIPSAPIQGIVNSRRWKELINYLIDTVPRVGNPNLYDM